MEDQTWRHDVQRIIVGSVKIAAIALCGVRVFAPDLKRFSVLGL
jgi:hypothetical protein